MLLSRLNLKEIKSALVNHMLDDEKYDEIKLEALIFKKIDDMNQSTYECKWLEIEDIVEFVASIAEIGQCHLDMNKNTTDQDKSKTTISTGYNFRILLVDLLKIVHLNNPVDSLDNDIVLLNSTNRYDNIIQIFSKYLLQLPHYNCLIDTGKSQFLEYNFDFLSIVLKNSITEIAPLMIIKPEIIMFGKKVHQQRDVGFFSDTSEGYTYSNKLMPSQKVPNKTKELMNIVNRLFAANYNGILINRYQDGNNSIGKHSDDEKNLDSNAGVVMISIGAVRKFRIRSKRENGYYDFDTKNEHCYVMCGDFQKEFTHEIPIEKKIKETRYSFTFRYHTK